MSDNNSVSSEPKNLLHVSSAPHIRKNQSTRQIHLFVVAALAPCTIASLALYGWRSLMLTAVSVIAALLCDYLFARFWKKQVKITEYSALITALAYSCTLPAGMNPLAAALGAIVAIALGKWAFGGLGNSVVNPALLGRAFVALSYPTQFVKILPNIYGVMNGSGGFHHDLFSGATPFHAACTIAGSGMIQGLHFGKWILAVAVGNSAGFIGATSLVAVLLGAILLYIRKILPYSTPLAILLSLYLLELAWCVFGGKLSFEYSSAAALILALSGGVPMAAFFLACDPAISPSRASGRIAFGAGIAVTTFVLRHFTTAGADGLFTAILFMNCLVPIIEHLSRPKPFGMKGSV